MEQLSLFDIKENLLADRICEIFNSFNTKYRNTFIVNKVELEKWEHVSSKNKNLTIILKSPLADNFDENSFTQFNLDKTDEQEMNKGLFKNDYIQELYKDKDFSIHITPNLILIYYLNFEFKEIKI